MLVARAINVRLDPESERALRLLKSARGLTSSEAVRAALTEAAAQLVSDEEIRQAARRIANDPNERLEAEELDRLFGDPWDGVPL